MFCWTIISKTTGVKYNGFRFLPASKIGRCLVDDTLVLEADITVYIGEDDVSSGSESDISASEDDIISAVCPVQPPIRAASAVTALPLASQSIKVPPASQLIKMPPASQPIKMHTMLTEPCFQDVRFRFPDSTETLSCHRCVLALWSPVFKAMFHSEMSETSSGEIFLEDVEPGALKELLVRLYTGSFSEAKVFSELGAEILQIACRYSIAEVIKECEDQLGKHLSRDNVLSIIIASEASGSKRLKDCCLKFIAKNCVDVLHSVNFSKLVAEK
jgi:hypothetical protein